VDTATDILTSDEIRLIYESGPDEVITLVKRLQSEIVLLSERVTKLEARVSFDSFLLYLDSDRERAGERYTKLHKSLTNFFAWCGSTDPETRTIETLDILCRQVSEGRQIDDLERYGLGVARKILLKEQIKRDTNEMSLDGIQTDYDLRFSFPSEQKLVEAEVNQALYDECMRSCLQKLSENDSLLISKYSAVGGHDKENREKLAIEAGISLPALRVRVNRIRGILRECLKKCLKQG